MPRNGFTRKVPAFGLLPEGEIEAIHCGILKTLAETGVRMDGAWAPAFLAQHGCHVDEHNHRVRFPPELVTECLALAPHTFTIRAPDPVNDLLMGGDTIYYSHSAGLETIDLDTFEPRSPTKAEFEDAVRVMDYLPTLDHMGCYPYFGYEGVHPLMGIPEGVAINMRHSTKHQAACCSYDCEIFTIQMAQALGHEITGTLTSSSPLSWNEQALTAARRMVEAGFPISTVDGCVLGGTGPATVSGSLVVSLAEHMAMIVLVQLLNPGQRIILGHFALGMNMKSGAPAFGMITSSLSNVAFNQMVRHYGLPVGNGSPGYTSAKKIDYQAGYEKAIQVLLSALSGGNTILLHLGVSGEMTAHPVQAILDNDVAGMVGRFVEGEQATPEMTALDLIAEIGPLPGHFLGLEHTRRWWRHEQYQPGAADRLTYAEWQASGKRGALELAQERMAQILARHDPRPLTSGQDADIERILVEARAYFSRQELA
jgi:trimethylamine---corrinoid protein Co-methyltransferase